MSSYTIGDLAAHLQDERPHLKADEAHGIVELHIERIQKLRQDEIDDTHISERDAAAVLSSIFSARHTF